MEAVRVPRRQSDADKLELDRLLAPELDALIG
jgi:hypothetical protein